MTTRSNIEKRAEKLGLGFTETSSMEKAQQGESEGMRWRLFQKTQNGHGLAGGHYFKTLADADDYISMREQDLDE